ncbi:MAG: glycosyltransferase [bacterium]
MYRDFSKLNNNLQVLEKEIKEKNFITETKYECSYIILSGLSNADSLDKMLESFVKTTDNLGKSEIIIISNGSFDHTPEVVNKNLKGFDYILIYLNPNRGIAGGFNEGLKRASGKYICVLQDDIIIYQPGWNTNLSAFLDKYDRIGAIGFLLEKKGDLKPTQAVVVSSMYCITMMFRQGFGLWDELYNPNSLEDFDFCYRIRSKGYEICGINLDIYHPPLGELSTVSVTRKISGISNKICSYGLLLSHLFTKRYEEILNHENNFDRFFTPIEKIYTLYPDHGSLTP